MSNIRTEIIAGFVTFTTMAYAICVQPAIMSGTMPGMTPTGMDMNALVTTTCIAAALSCFVMGFWAQYPIALAPGMGMNFLLVLSVMPACAQALGSHVGAEEVWRLALGTVFVSGAIFVLLASLKMCSAMVNIISPSMTNAMAVALGMFIAFFGMKNGGLITVSSNGLDVGNLLTPEVAVCVIGLISGFVLLYWKVPGALLISIIISSFAAFQFHLISFSNGIIGMPADPRPVIGIVDIPGVNIGKYLGVGAIDVVGVWRHLDKLWPSLLVLAFLDFFGAFSTCLGVLKGGGVIPMNSSSKGNNEDGFPRSRRVFVTNGLGTMIGSVFGHSTITSYVESAAGVGSGGRTGLTSIVVGILFLLALPFAPFVAALGSCAPICAPALIIVGSMMFQCVKNIDWNDISEAAPAFITIVGMTYTNSITNGILMGLIIYPIVKLLTGRVRDIHPGMWILFALLVGYLFIPK